MNAVINRKTKFIDLGLKEYKEAWDYQLTLFERSLMVKGENRTNEIQKPTENHLLFVEHPHVYTLGKSGDENNLLLKKEALSEINASYFPTNRGGDITYHGPGQIVGYPILDLENFFTDIHKYMRTLEEAVILTLAEYGIEGKRIAGLTGVWIDSGKSNVQRKICALGVKTSRWITMHGFALNVNTDLNYFGNIVPCGIQDKAVTSIEHELGVHQNMDEVKNRLKQKISLLFEMELI